MLFHTPEFMILLFITIALYYAFPAKRLYVLTAANILFYCVSGIGMLALFAIMTLFTYYSSRYLTGAYRKWVLWAILLVNLGNLCFFKYAVFMIRNVEKVLSIKLLTEDSFLLSLVLPVGISFYTFEFISYAVDIYKQKIKPSRSLLEFWMFISFFAHLIAGPIMRGNEFLPQVEKLSSLRLNTAFIRLGSFYLVLGLVKKMMLADPIADRVNVLFSDPYALTGSAAWISTYLFAFQIYFDFSAYSDMAIGIGYLFGLQLPQNFLTPYLSSNATEFWRRWHITLSNWIRDYIYIPLGGSRKGEIRKYVFLFIAMTASGIWHGALWTFILWGMYHGFLLIMHNLYSTAKKKLHLEKWNEFIIYRWFTILIFFHLTCIGWVMFRIHDRHVVFLLLRRMLSPDALHVPSYMLIYLYVAIFLFGLHLLEHWLLAHRSRISELWHRFFPSPVRAACYTLVIIILIIMLRSGESSFIYFQF
ncbi:MBOAT family protein [Paenibacillus sp. SYP-B3998]|uniref:MBOAT family protein n=1 Tax=Paenibacillus sp. SYP-B3998 TaxID=2678564 RepID=A0A6G3ZVN6_9BACL|nr:MBOAT family protein [Paenibacillus sp. SYP-B3998]NEW06286.1 MBOAT family protein [Paenibacillus sp. SYP-B3998]